MQQIGLHSQKDTEYFKSMRKSRRSELTPEQTHQLMVLAQEERHPIEVIRKEFDLTEQEVIDIVRTQINGEKFEMWKKRAQAAKPKPKPPKIDDFDDDLDGKYYIRNKFD